MLDYLKLANNIDAIADKIEGLGCIREAFALDKIADALETMNSLPPEAVNIAREVGLNLRDPAAVAEFIAKNLNSAAAAAPGGMESKEALNISPKLRNYAALAMILANAFLATVQAKGATTILTPQGVKTFSVQQVKHIKESNPETFAEIMKGSKIFENLEKEMLQDIKSKGSVTVNTNMGPETYNMQSIQDLKSADPKSYATAVELYGKQAPQAQSQAEISESNRARAEKAPKPGAEMKTVADREERSDAFGNEATVITYADGSMSMEGDIYEGGVSLRDRLERAGKIAPDQSAKHLPRR